MGLTLDESETETPEEIDGVAVLLDEQVKPYIDGQLIDYIDDQVRGTGFVIQSETGSC